MEGNVLVSPAERQAFQKLLALGLHDSFRCFPQEEQAYSWWDTEPQALDATEVCA